MLLHDMMKILQKAQNMYGFANQVNVAAEECCELAAVCTKYARFDSHEAACDKIREKIVEETADVTIVLHHLYMIFNITPEEQGKYMEAKLERLQRWMDESQSLEQSTVDRKVNIQGTVTGRTQCSQPNNSSIPVEEDHTYDLCSDCMYFELYSFEFPCNECANHNKWTSPTKKPCNNCTEIPNIPISCSNCRFIGQSADIEPCATCDGEDDGYHNWMPPNEVVKL